MDTILMEIYYIVDKFCKEIKKSVAGGCLTSETGQEGRKKVFTMLDSEIITIRRTMNY